MRQEVTFELRNPFPELESICYEFNKMILSGMGNHAQLELNESGDNEYITIKMFRKRNYPSIVINRDIIPSDFETSKISSKIKNEILFFKTDSDGTFITIYICDCYNEIPDNSCSFKKFPAIKFDKAKPLLDVKFELRKTFYELEAFASIINSMLAQNVRSHVSISSDNHFKISFLYNNVDRPSLVLEIGLVKGIFPKKKTHLLSKYNIACSREIPLMTSFCVLPPQDNCGQIIHIYVYEPDDSKLLEELNKQFTLFSI